MSEANKVDLGSIKIHKTVLSEITFSAISEVKGVSLVPKDFFSSVLDIFGMKNFPGISVNVDKNNQVVIEVKVIVDYGVNIPDAARQAQDVVRDAIEKTVDVDLKDVNVNIHGIDRRDQ